MSAKRMAVVQMVSGPDLAHNLCAADRLLAEARARGAVLAVLPENFALFGAGAPAAFLRSQFPGRHAILAWLADTSRRLGLWLVGGSLPWLPDARRQQPFDRVYSHCPVFSPAGDCVAAYNKMHLFDAEVADSQGYYRESDDFLAGDR